MFLVLHITFLQMIIDCCAEGNIDVFLAKNNNFSHTNQNWPDCPSACVCVTINISRCNFLLDKQVETPFSFHGNSYLASA